MIAVILLFPVPFFLADLCSLLAGSVSEQHVVQMLLSYRVYPDMQHQLVLVTEVALLLKKINKTQCIIKNNRRTH